MKKSAPGTVSRCLNRHLRHPGGSFKDHLEVVVEGRHCQDPAYTTTCTTLSSPASTTLSRVMSSQAPLLWLRLYPPSCVILINSQLQPLTNQPHHAALQRPASVFS